MTPSAESIAAWPAPALSLAHGRGIVSAIWRHPANRGRRLRSLAQLLKWQFVKHVLRRPMTIAFHGRQLICYPDSPSSSGAIYFSGYPDYWEMKFLQAYLRPGDAFLDVGANIGMYTVLASASIGQQGRIDAFEPAQLTAARLEEQGRLNGLAHLHVHRFAVSDANGEVEFGYSGNDAMAHIRRDGEAEGRRTKVRTITLDTFTAYGNYAAGKMDIEGAEPLALSGAGQRLHQANPPVWLLELAGYSRLYGVTSDEVVRRLAVAGYVCAIYDPDSAALHYTQTPWVHGVQNVLAIASDHRPQVEQRLREHDRP